MGAEIQKKVRIRQENDWIQLAVAPQHYRYLLKKCPSLVKNLSYDIQLFQQCAETRHAHRAAIRNATILSGSNFLNLKIIIRTFSTCWAQELAVPKTRGNPHHFAKLIICRIIEN